MNFYKGIQTALMFEDFDQTSGSSRGKEISELEILDLIKRDCGEWVSNPFPFIRGKQNTGDFLYYDPKEKSRNATGYYEFFGDWYNHHIDNDRRWSQFPKRKKSIIGSSKPNFTFGPGWYMVIPFDGFKIGVVENESDLFDSMKYFQETTRLWLPSTRYIFHDLSKYLMKVLEFEVPDSWSSWLKFLDLLTFENISEVLNDPDFSISGSESYPLPKDLLRFRDAIDNKNVRELFSEAMDPIKNKIKLIDNSNSGSLISLRSSEIWTDSNCYLVRIKTSTYDIEPKKELENLIEKLK